MPTAKRFAAAAALALALSGCGRSDVVHVGSKKFTESAVLGEMLTQLARSTGVTAEHLEQLGDTNIVWNGLKAGQLDAYCEYTGTFTQDILSREHVTEDALPDALAREGLRLSRPLGFNNGYALGMKRGRAEALGIRRISDLKKHPDLRLGLSTQFLTREKDGWEPLRRFYGLPQPTPNGSEHDIAVLGVARGALDVTDIYSTDAKLRALDLVTLEDDRHFFPRYDAVIVYRADLEERHPEVVREFRRLEGQITDAEMIALNARVEVGPADDRLSPAQAASEFLGKKLNVQTTVTTDSLAHRLAVTTGQHLLLVGVSLAAAVLAAVPLGVLAARRPWLGQAILALVGVVQTIPSVALLVLVLAALRTGYGALPAIVALFLYSLLPIVRNTYTGLHDIPLQVRESAEALGLSPGARLRLIELPMASRSILAGIKTAAVINVGTATLGGLIAAGGYGQPIFAGLNRVDYPQMMEGAIPAVVLALLVQGLFDLAERFLVPKGLRLQAAA